MKHGLITCARHYNKSAGSSRIRGDSLLPHWPEAEHYQIGHDYDSLIFQKVNWLQMASQFKGVKVYDICDPLWLESPTSLETLAVCDGVVAPTQLILDALKSFGVDKPMVVIDDHVDPAFGSPKGTFGQSEIKSAVWFGYSDTDYLLAPFIPQLRRQGIELHVISNQHYPSADRWFPFDITKLCEQVTRCDVVIMPDYSSDTTNPKLPFKSLNKTYQSWMWGMPVISWPEQLDEFQDPIKRRVEGLSRREEMLSTKVTPLAVKQWRSFLDSLVCMRDG